MPAPIRAYTDRLVSPTSLPAENGRLFIPMLERLKDTFDFQRINGLCEVSVEAGVLS